MTLGGGWRLVACLLGVAVTIMGGGAKGEDATSAPSDAPTAMGNETLAPTTHAPSDSPTSSPTMSPTKFVTMYVCESELTKVGCKAVEWCYWYQKKCRHRIPTNSPTLFPTRAPTAPTTKRPTRSPTKYPTRKPTRFPTTGSPTKNPTKSPTYKGYVPPTRRPTTRAPTLGPRTLDGTFRIYGESVEAALAQKAAIEGVLESVLGAAFAQVTVAEHKDGGVAVSWDTTFDSSKLRADASSILDENFQSALQTALRQSPAFSSAVTVNTSLEIVDTDEIFQDQETGVNPIFVILVIVLVGLALVIGAIFYTNRDDIIDKMSGGVKMLKKTLVSSGTKETAHEYNSTRDLGQTSQNRSRTGTTSSAETPQIAMSAAPAPPPAEPHRIEQPSRRFDSYDPSTNMNV